MARYYLPTTPPSFYDSDVMPPPEGAVPISDEDHHALFVGQAQGFKIVADAHGRVHLSTHPAPPATNPRS